jgi:hypothetical protein
MIWFLRLFPAFMILFPLGFTLFAGRHPERASDEGTQLMRRLWSVTLAAITIHIAVVALTETDPEAWRLLRAAWPVGFGTGSFMVIWFGFAMKALQARQPGYRNLPNPGSPEPVRSASLTPRDTTSPVPRGAWFAGWAVFGLCAGATGWALLQGVPSMLILGLAFWLGMGVFGSQASLTEAEPMDTAGSPELAEAWGRLRSFKAWCFYGMGLIGTIGFAAVAVITVFAPGVAGMSGAIFGTAGGIAGGVFGTMASVRRARVNALLQELGTREANGPAQTA